MEIQSYHAHIYYPVEDVNKVEVLLKKVRENFDLKIGRAWDKPVGPHPVGSCQISVPTDQFQNFIPWLMTERMGFDVMIHPNTGNDLLDHTDHVLWLGKCYKLKTHIFE